MSTGAGPEYNRVHYLARKLLKESCERCPATTRLQAALRPDAPEDNLRMDDISRCAYSVDPADYLTLCQPCHRRMDLVEGRTHCKHQHAYTPENTAIRRDGSRRCPACHRAQETERLQDPDARARKNAADRGRRLTPEQKARKLELQRVRRARS